jgi:oligoendopeptidase F
LVELGYVRPGLETVVERFRNHMQLFNEANVPLFAELSSLSTRWSKVNGALSVEWEGEEKTPAQLLPFLLSNDRAIRERAFRLRAKPYLEHHEVLGEIFDRMLDLRQQVARNAGFANYRDFAHREKNRFDYTPTDCLRFHEAVESAVLPAAERIMERRRRRMSLDRLRPWDMDVDPEGRLPLKPFQEIDTFIDRAAAVFAHVDPEFRVYFQRMAHAKLLDLDNRKGKAPGGYCQTLAFSKMPLIFMNAVGIDSDLTTLLHESGHAFHSFEASELPILFQRHPGSEMAEVASMSMELLAAPFIDRANGGYYSDEEARRSRTELLEGIVLFFPHCASVDAFQQWSTPTMKGAMPARGTRSGSSCAGDSRATWSIGAAWIPSASRAGTSNRISTPPPSITSSTGSRSSALFRFGETACMAAPTPSANIARPSPSAPLDRCRIFSKRLARE